MLIVHIDVDPPIGPRFNLCQITVWNRENGDATYNARLRVQSTMQVHDALVSAGVFETQVKSDGGGALTLLQRVLGAMSGVMSAHDIAYVFPPRPGMAAAVAEVCAQRLAMEGVDLRGAKDTRSTVTELVAWKERFVTMGRIDGGVHDPIIQLVEWLEEVYTDGDEGTEVEDGAVGTPDGDAGSPDGPGSGA